MAQESTIAAQVLTALAEHFKRPASEIRPQDDLRTDLGLNSLDILELLFKLEEKFDLEIPDSDLSDITSVGNLIAYLEHHLETPTETAMSSAAAAIRPDAEAPRQAPRP
jgi:acyl carrier protein